MKFQSSLALASVAAVANAHTIFTQLKAGGTQYPISYAIRDPTYDGPITDVVTNNDVACNGGPNPTMSSPYVIEVTAGETVQATWRHGLSSTPENEPTTYVIDPSHLGPVMAYMKKVTNATTDPGYGSGWFKISEEGYNAATGVWAVTNLISAGGVQQITIPKCIPNGQYLLRAELIALHGAGSANGAQFYMECAQINVSGGTGTATPSVVALPGAYASTDPGILINIYYPTVSTYTIPGPTKFTCPGTAAPTSVATSSKASTTTASTLVTSTKATSSSSSSKASTTSSSTKASSSTTTTKASTSSTKTSSSATSTASGAALYGQCGGDPASYTGPLTCAQGTCTYSNPYFSQCL